MTTKEPAKDLRQRQDDEWRLSSDSLRAVGDSQDSIWEELREELNSGIEGYGAPRYGHVLQQGVVGLSLGGIETTAADIARKALVPFLDHKASR